MFFIRVEWRTHSFKNRESHFFRALLTSDAKNDNFSKKMTTDRKSQQKPTNNKKNDIFSDNN